MICPCSSVGSSTWLLTTVSQVRVLSGAPQPCRQITVKPSRNKIARVSWLISGAKPSGSVPRPGGDQQVGAMDVGRTVIPRRTAKRVLLELPVQGKVGLLTQLAFRFETVMGQFEQSGLYGYFEFTTIKIIKTGYSRTQKVYFLADLPSCKNSRGRCQGGR